MIQEYTIIVIPKKNLVYHPDARTRANKPYEPPVTCQASFEIERYPANRDIFVYWQQLDARYHNGPDFHYEIVKILSDEKPYLVDSMNVSSSFAKFSGMPLDKSFTFFVNSFNSEGHAASTSEVFVPMQEDISVLAPMAVTTIYNEEALDELKISWIVPPGIYDIESFTIFWCPLKGWAERSDIYGLLFM